MKESTKAEIKETLRVNAFGAVVAAFAVSVTGIILLNATNPWITNFGLFALLLLGISTIYMKAVRGKGRRVAAHKTSNPVHLDLLSFFSRIK